MIRPHGNDLIDCFVDAARSDTIRQNFAELPHITLDAESLADLRNIATGVYSPLRGFMSQHDFLKVINDMTLESGVAWTPPIVLDVDIDTASGVVPGDRVGLVTPDAPVAPYQRASTGAQTQASMLRRLELSVADHERLIDACDAADITFLLTPFDTAD